MKKDTTQFIATFIIVLVLMLPFYVSDVHAVSTLVTDKFEGTGEVPYFVSGDYDELHVEILATVTEQIRDITRTQLDIHVEGIENPYLFDECHEEAGAADLFRCTYVRDGTFRGTQAYTINLYEEGTDTVLESNTHILTADSYGAVITDMSVSPDLTNDGEVAVTFEAEDYSVDRGDTSECSGFDKIEFRIEDMYGAVAQTILPSSGCTHSDTFTYTFPSSISGQTQICGIAYDMLGQAGDARCEAVVVDRDAPAPVSDSISITVEGEDLIFVNPNAAQPILADVAITITADDIVEDSVTADFSAITDNPGFNDKAYSRFSVESSDTYIYTWTDVPIELVSSCLVVVKGEDDAENQMSDQVFCSVSTDIQGPEVLELVPLYEDGSGVPYISAIEGELGIIFGETGGGMDPQKVYLDLKNINGQARAKAKTCEQEEGTTRWFCIWEDITAAAGDGVYPVSVRKDSSDRLGNEMTDAYVFDMGIDTVAPELDEDNVDFQSYHTDIDYGDVTVNGDVIEIIIPIAGFESAFADFSSVGGPTDLTPVTWWEDENGTFALFSYTIGVSGPYTANIGFDFYDFSGNHVSTTYGFEVSGIKNESSPDYWGISSITCSPQTIDRSITTLLAGGVKSFCKVDLQAKGNVEITAIGLGDLSECSGDVPDYITDINIMMNSPGTEEVYIVATLGLVNINKDTLNFECPLYMMSKVTEPDGVYYTENPEIEFVSKDLLFYDMPLGEPGSRIKDKIQDADDNYKIAGAWVDDFETFFYWYEQACNWIGMLTDVVNAFQAVSALLGTISLVYKPAAKLWEPVCKFSDEATSFWKDANDNFFDYVCALATCSYSTWLFKQIGGVEFAKSFNVKKSLVWSTVGLCVPGMLRGVNKWRQLECQRALCYASQVANGMKIYECDASYSFSICKFILGELFNAIPITQVLSNYMGMAESYISNPGELVGWILTLIFDYFKICEKTNCMDGVQAVKIGCNILSAVAMVGKVISDGQALNDMHEGGWKTPNTMCSQWEDYKDKLREDGQNII